MGIFRPQTGGLSQEGTLSKFTGLSRTQVTRRLT